jgi:hypothetical protein
MTEPPRDAPVDPAPSVLPGFVLRMLVAPADSASIAAAMSQVLDDKALGEETDGSCSGLSIAPRQAVADPATRR